jgi:hypothetical protein
MRASRAMSGEHTNLHVVIIAGPQVRCYAYYVAESSKLGRTAIGAAHLCVLSWFWGTRRVGLRDPSSSRPRAVQAV